MPTVRQLGCCVPKHPRAFEKLPFHTAPERSVSLEVRGSSLIKIWNEIGCHLSTRRWKMEVFLLSIQNMRESGWLQQEQVVFQSDSICLLWNGEIFLVGRKLSFLRSFSEPAVALNEVQGKLGNSSSHIWCAVNAGCHQPWSSLSSPGRFSLLLLPSMDDECKDHDRTVSNTPTNVSFTVGGSKVPHRGCGLGKISWSCRGVNLLGSKREYGNYWSTTSDVVKDFCNVCKGIWSLCIT